MNLAQDLMLEKEGRSSMESMESFETKDSMDDHASKGSEDGHAAGFTSSEMDVDPLPTDPMDVDRLPVDPADSYSGAVVYPESKSPNGNLPSRMSRRRTKLAASENPRKSKKQRLQQWRFERAMDQTVQTEIQLNALKPGLKLADCEKKVYTLAELRAKGFAVVSWGGS